MRITTLTLAIYIGFLTVQPVLSPVSGCELKVEKKKSHNSCSKNKTKDCQKQEPGKCPISGICNPFNDCTCCLAAPEPSFEPLNKSTASRDFQPFPSAFVVSNYLADCFHPPEVA